MFGAFVSLKNVGRSEAPEDPFMSTCVRRVYARMLSFYIDSASTNRNFIVADYCIFYGSTLY